MTPMSRVGFDPTTTVYELPYSPYAAQPLWFAYENNILIIIKFAEGSDSYVSGRQAGIFVN
jgi:hypothetical protein